MSVVHLTLSEAAKLAPTRPSSNAVWRWCRRGIKARNGQRVYLGHVRVGGRIYTTEENVQRFFAELAEADREHFAEARKAPAQQKPRTESARQKAIARAEAELAKAGI